MELYIDIYVYIYSTCMVTVLTKTYLEHVSCSISKKKNSILSCFLCYHNGKGMCAKTSPVEKTSDGHG